MSEHPWFGRRRTVLRPEWGLLALASCWATSACLSDVAVPDCVLDQSCDAADGGVAGADGPSIGGTSTPSGGRGGTGSAIIDPVVDPIGRGGQSEGGGGEPGGVGGEAGECSDCVVLPAELNSPCAGRSYTATLRVNGGVAPYQWRLSPPVDHWSVTADPAHPTRAMLVADPAGAGQTDLTVIVRDSRGLEKPVSYSMIAREACWFAYTGQTGDEQTLQLVDPFAEQTEENTPPALENNHGVYDFRFSPDGQYLAYRYGLDGQHPKGRHLALVELSTLREHELPFAEEAVTAYAWSPNSSVLAVGFAANGQQYLGGVRLPALGSDPPLALVAVKADVNDNLSWVGSDFVAYYAELDSDPQSPDHFQTPIYAKLGQTGFGDQQVTSDSFEGGLSLQPAAEGFWIINSPFTTFFPTTDPPSDSVLHLDASLVSPSGKYSAALDGQTLQLFAANDGTQSYPLATSGAQQPCPMPLAWSSRDTVACVADVANAGAATHHGEVRFFDVKPGNGALQMTTLGGSCGDDVALANAASCTFKRLGYGYDVDRAAASPRGFSPSGRWFGFARAEHSDAYLYWADLDASPPILTNGVFFAEHGGISRLAFSPDDEKIAFQAGEWLVVENLSGVTLERKILGNFALDYPCSEDFPSAPDQYCGNSERGARFKWALDSKALAFPSGGLVIVVDTTQSAGLAAFPQSTPLCEELCSGNFEFQPVGH